jgi:hypothetical protein
MSTQRCSLHVQNTKLANSLYLISFARFTILTYLISPKEEIPKYLSWDYLKLNYFYFFEPITDAQYPSLKKKNLNFVGQY